MAVESGQGKLLFAKKSAGNPEVFPDIADDHR
jgi:hypothetical protein